MRESFTGDGYDARRHHRDPRHGADIPAGQRPQGIVPSGAWQMARSTGAWTLVGCTVAPGFTFAGFKLAPPGFDPGDHPA